MINTQINELVAYGLKCGLVSKDDQIFVSNQLLDLFRLSEFHEEEILKSRPLCSSEGNSGRRYHRLERSI